MSMDMLVLTILITITMKEKLHNKHNKLRTIPEKLHKLKPMSERLLLSMKTKRIKLTSMMEEERSPLHS